MTGAEALLRTLTRNGIDTCFMNPGTSEMHFVAALDRVPEMRGVLCLFEGVCSGAADGYARMTGRPAATLLHLGPGLANGLANFHNARKARVPVVSIVGEHSTQHLEHDAPLTADIEAFARTVSSAVFRPRSPSDLGPCAEQTVAAALEPPGQVATLIVPADFSWSEGVEPGGVAPRPVCPVPDADRLAYAKRLLGRGAETGILLSGTALYGEALIHARMIAASTGVRIFANRNAARMECGLVPFRPTRIPYFPEPAQKLLAGLRHLILVEAKAPVSFFGYPETRSTLAPEDCELFTLADLHEDGTQALSALAGSGGGGFGGGGRVAVPHGTGPLTPDIIGQTLEALLPEGAIVSDEMVSAGEAVWQHLVNAASHDHLPVTGGSIGQGLPVALGAAIACPDRKVLALEADGSGMYTLQALWTIARENLDVTTVIFANRRYRILDIEMQRTGAQGFGTVANDMIDIGRPDLDWVKLSEGLGVAATRAVDADGFVSQFRAAMRQCGPRLIEAVLP